jgi:hypothetical protein
MHSPNTLVVRCEDHRFADDESNTDYRNHVFVRLVAMRRTFSKVDFRYCVFDGSYLRECKFLDCDFTGTRFLSSNFHESSFSGCKFEYAIFEKTQIAPDILETQAPHFENLKARFARSLRTNYQQLGDADSANKAIKIELQATKTHLYEAWHSKKDYYRLKYPGWQQIGVFFRWLWFMMLHFLWGNGESALRLMAALLVLFFLMGVYHAYHVLDPGRVKAYWDGFCVAPEVYLGVRTFPQYGHWYVTVIAATRLLTFAGLTSILIKRFNRR